MEGNAYAYAYAYLVYAREHDFSNECMVLNGFLRGCERKDMSLLLLLLLE